MRVNIQRGRWALAGVSVCALLAGCVHVSTDPWTPLPAPPVRPAPPRPSPPPPAPRPLPPGPVTREPVAPAPSAFAMSQTVLLAIQTRLDADNFSPGGLDGRWGTKSENALAAWQKKYGHPITGQVDDTALAALGQTNGLFTTYIITTANHAALTPYPASWLERSRQERLGYSSIEEMVAEQFHLYRATLRQLNPQVAWPNPPAGTIVTVPATATKPLPRLSKIEIRIAQKTLRAYDTNGLLVAHFPCSIAADKTKRPVNQTLRVVVWAENPEYTFDPALFAADPAAAGIGKKLRIPPGPNNPVGLAWIGLDRPGYGIHGSPAPEDISKTESHGCFRLTNWDAGKLVRAVRDNLPVIVLP